MRCTDSPPALIISTAVLLCCNCNAHLYFHLITTVHTLITREAANRIKANWIMWEYKQKNGGKETRREKRGRGQHTLSNECSNTSDWHLLSHKGNTVWFHSTNCKGSTQTVIVTAPLKRTDTCFYYSSKNEEFHCFWVFCKTVTLMTSLEAILCLWRCFCAFCLPLWSIFV